MAWINKRWFFQLVNQATFAAVQGDGQASRGAERKLLGQVFIDLLEQRRAGGGGDSDLAGFFAYCHERLDRSYSQILQDLWVVYTTGEKQGGIFVDIGASDGQTLSNSYLLEQDYGWTGIAAEPNPDSFARLSARRSCACVNEAVLGQTGEAIEFWCTDRADFSRVAARNPGDQHESNGNRSGGRYVTVPATTLTELLARFEAPADIDYLSLDTEGAELEILQNFDFQRYRIGAITVEHNQQAGPRQQIHELLSAQGYRRVLPEMSRWDDFYVRAA